MKIVSLPLFSLYRKFLKSSEIVYNRLEIKNDITKELRKPLPLMNEGLGELRVSQTLFYAEL